MNNNLFKRLLISLLFIFIVSCEEHKGNKFIYLEDPNYVTINSVEKDNLLIVLYQKSDRININVGFNDLYLYFYDTKKGTIISEIEYSCKVYLDEGNIKTESAIFPATECDYLKLFPIPTYFINSNNEITNWTLEVNYKYKGKDYSQKFILEVGENPFFSYFEYNSSTYYINQIEPKIQKIGVSDFDFVIIKRDSTFQYFNDAACTMKVYNEKTESSNNIAPVSQGNGYYKGTIYIPEKGAWQVETDLYINDKNIYKYVYPIYIKIAN